MNQNEFYKNLLDNLYDGVYFVDCDRRITYWNKASERITGYKAEQMVGKFCRDNLLNHCLENGFELCKTACPLTATIKNGAPHEAEVYLHHADGHRIPVLVRATPIYGETGQIEGAVEIFSKNTAILKARRRIHALEQTAYADPLTGLGNRGYIEQKLKTALLETETEQCDHALLFLDIDHFKRVNDTFGHLVGDRVLTMVANNLSSNLREGDLPARWGGEEFLVLLSNIEPSETPLVAEKLRALMESSNIQVNGTMLNVSVSIGATMFHAEDTLQTVIQRADELMYQSKSAGRNRVTFQE